MRRCRNSRPGRLPEQVSISREVIPMPRFLLRPLRLLHVSNRYSRTAIIFAFALLSLLSVRSASAQGCILARSPEGGLPTGQGGILEPGHFQLTIGERHQFSYQHYVGDVYQVTRAQDHTQVENRINLLTFNLTYQWRP